MCGGRCYIGQKRLQAALTQFPDVDFAITWKPFFLNPDAPKEGISKMDYYLRKFGAARVESMVPGAPSSTPPRDLPPTAPPAQASHPAPKFPLALAPGPLHPTPPRPAG